MSTIYGFDIAVQLNDEKLEKSEDNETFVNVYKLSNEKLNDFILGRFNIRDEIYLREFNDGVGPVHQSQDGKLSDEFLIYKNVKLSDDLDSCYLPFLSDCPVFPLSQDIKPFSSIEKEEKDKIEQKYKIQFENISILYKSRPLVYKQGKSPYYRIYIGIRSDNPDPDPFIFTVWNSQVRNFNLSINQEISLASTLKNRFYGKALHLNSYSDSYFVSIERHKQGNIYLSEKQPDVDTDNKEIDNLDQNTNKVTSHDESLSLSECQWNLQKMSSKLNLPFSHTVCGLIISISPPFKRRRSAKQHFLSEENTTDDVQDFYFIKVLEHPQMSNDLNENVLASKSEILTVKNVLFFNDESSDFYKLKSGDNITIRNLYKTEDVYISSIFTNSTVDKNTEIIPEIVSKYECRTGHMSLFDIPNLPEELEIGPSCVIFDQKTFKLYSRELLHCLPVVQTFSISDYDEIHRLSQNLIINEGVFIETDCEIVGFEEGVVIEHQKLVLSLEKEKSNDKESKARNNYVSKFENDQQKTLSLNIKNEKGQTLKIYCTILPDKKTKKIKFYMVRVDYDTVLSFIV